MFFLTAVPKNRFFSSNLNVAKCAKFGIICVAHLMYDANLSSYVTLTAYIIVHHAHLAHTEVHTSVGKYRLRNSVLFLVLNCAKVCQNLILCRCTCILSSGSIDKYSLYNTALLYHM